MNQPDGNLISQLVSSRDRRILKWLSELSKAEKVLCAVFCLTCFQLATKFPNITLVPGERAKVFSGLLCGVTLFALIIAKRGKIRLNSPEWVICLTLSLLCLVSGLFSEDMSSSLWRALILIFSGVGGFWCGRLLFNHPFALLLLARLCLIVLIPLICLGVAGYHLHDNVLHFVDIHKHILNNLLLVLSFGPLYLLLNGERSHKIIGGLYLVAEYYVLSLSFDPMIWFPPLLLGGVLLFRLNKRQLGLALIPLVCLFLLVGYFHSHKLQKRFFDMADISYWVRAENVSFSYHIAKKKPLTGIGLVAPRQEYLNDYSMVYPYVNKDQFAAILPKENRSSENQFLTFMADLGFPFLFLYTFSVLILYIRLIRWMLMKRKVTEINPIIIWVPVTAALLHFQFFDGLLHPQTSWFFHLFLGMIPTKEKL